MSSLTKLLDSLILFNEAEQEAELVKPALTDSDGICELLHCENFTTCGDCVFNDAHAHKKLIKIRDHIQTIELLAGDL